MFIGDVPTVCNLYTHLHLTFNYFHHKILQYVCVLVVALQHECVLMWPFAAPMCGCVLVIVIMVLL